MVSDEFEYWSLNCYDDPVDGVTTAPTDIENIGEYFTALEDLLLDTTESWDLADYENAPHWIDGS